MERLSTIPEVKQRTAEVILAKIGVDRACARARAISPVGPLSARRQRATRKYKS